MTSTSIRFHLLVSLLSTLATVSSQSYEMDMLGTAKIEVQQQRTLQGVEVTTKDLGSQKYTLSREEMAESPMDLMTLSEIALDADMEEFIHSSLGQKALSAVLASLVGEKIPAGIIAKAFGNQMPMQRDEYDILKLREEKRRLSQRDILHLTAEQANTNLKSSKQHSSSSVSAESIISPDQDDLKPRESSPDDKTISLEANVLPFATNTLFYSQDSEPEPQAHNKRYVQPWSSDYHEEQYDLCDDDYHDDIRFKASDFSAKNLARIAKHIYSHSRYFIDLMHYGWPFALEEQGI